MAGMDSKSNRQADAFAALTAADHARLDRLAVLAGSTAEDIWPAVYRYGFQDMEESVQANLDAQVEHAAGLTISHEDVMANAQRMIDSHAKQRKRRAG